jgi:DNA repair protein SbcD/Mre11
MAFRFIHAADLHLDMPFSGLSATAPEVVAELRDASLAAFDRLVRLAESREAAFVVIAGDVYDGAEHGVRAQLELHRGLSELSERGIRTFMVAGNHDPVEEGWSAIREWPELVTIFPADEAASVVVERDGAPLATVHGISYGRRDETDNLAERIVRDDGPGPHIAVLHANVGENPDHAPYSPCTVDDLVESGIDYWALGHVHSREVLHRDPWIVYPGNLQARSPEVTEVGAKGAYVVEVDDSGVIAEPEFVALDRVRFERIEHTIEGVADLVTLRERLVDIGHRRLAESDGRSVLLRVELVGRGPIHGELHRPGAVAELVDTLRSESLSEAPLLWWDRVDVSTRPVQDLDELLGRNDFVADLVEEAAALLDDESARSARVADWDDELPSDLAHLLGDALPRASDPDRWRQAEELAVDLVSNDET